MGTTLGALEFFEYSGKPIPSTNINPADYYIFQINSDFDSTIDPCKVNENYLTWVTSRDANNPELLKNAIDNQAAINQSTG
jgi:hypothetical protein